MTCPLVCRRQNREAQVEPEDSLQVVCDPGEGRGAAQTARGGQAPDHPTHQVSASSPRDQDRRGRAGGPVSLPKSYQADFLVWWPHIEPWALRPGTSGESPTCHWIGTLLLSRGPWCMWLVEVRLLFGVCLETVSTKAQLGGNGQCPRGGSWSQVATRRGRTARHLRPRERRLHFPFPKHRLRDEPRMAPRSHVSGKRPCVTADFSDRERREDLPTCMTLGQTCPLLNRLRRGRSCWRCIARGWLSDLGGD